MKTFACAMREGMLILAFGVSLTFGGIALAAETPAGLDGVTVVDAARAKALMDGGGRMIDTRVAAEYAEGHIIGAISVPYKEKSPKAADADLSQDSFDLAKLPGDKNVALIMYCNGPECWKSYKGAKAAAKAGWKKVNWFRGGFPEWKAKGLPTE